MIIPLFTIIYCAKTEWYRELPNRKHSRNVRIIGKWVRKNMPRSPMNSNSFKNQSTESIEFLENNSFTKRFHSHDKIGDDQIIDDIYGMGKYFINGNWILLETNKIEYEKKRNSKTNIEKNTFDHKLLYYYSPKEQVIIPMVYEKAFQESNFGVKDGVSEPYLEDNKLDLSIKIYTHKEFQPHAYFKDSEEK
jgi:hypothetical protein